MLRFSKFILKAYQSENSLISLCNRLTYYSNTPVANNYRSLGHLLNTNCIFNYQYTNLKLRIVNNRPIHNDTHIIGNCVRELCFVRDGSYTCNIFNQTDTKLLIDAICCT